MGTVTLSIEEYEELRQMRRQMRGAKNIPKFGKKKQRKASAYSKRYGAAFKRLQKKYKTKAGAWRKGGFKACQKAAHAAAKRGRK